MGESWTPFDLGVAPGSESPFTFHAGDPTKILFVGKQCNAGQCHENV
jgi:hypothetical protein